MSGYNVGHVGCREIEPFELDNWDNWDVMLKWDISHVNIFLSNSLIVRKMSDKWDFE